MRKTVAVFVVLLTVALPTFAQKIYIDYDRWARFSAYKTIAWVPTEETSVLDTSKLMHNRIKSIIMTQITSGRLTEDNEDPDLYITYHTDENEALRVDVDYWGYGYPGSWHWDPYWGGMGHAVPTVRTYTQGTLVVDIWHAKEKTLIWRGTSIGTVPADPEKNAKKIEKIIKKMAKKWNKMKPGF